MKLKSVNEEKFEELLLSKLESLSDDKVPNVRIVFLQELCLDFFHSPKVLDQLYTILKHMVQSDRDRDVVIFARKLLAGDTQMASTEC